MFQLALTKQTEFHERAQFIGIGHRPENRHSRTMQPVPSLLKTNLRGTAPTPSLKSSGTAPACVTSIAAGWEHVPPMVTAGGAQTLRITVRNVLGAAIVILGLSSCSSFHSDWRKTAATPAPATGMEGRWQGSWVSGVNGHHGRLRCLVSRLDGGQYQARFHAKYRKILSFGYTVSLAVEEHNGLFKFRGEADLGRLAGGKYQYEGTATATNYSSTYRSKYDQGTFQMVRP